MTRKILFFIFSLLLIVIFACEDKPKPNQPPILVVSANPTSGVVPLSVNYAASGQDPEGTALAYSWNFGDGKGTSSQENPVYVYTDAGVFTATCTVTDSGSPPLTAMSSVTVEILAHTPVLSSVTPAGCVMHVPSFTLTATGSDFQTGAKIVFNNVEMNTTYVSSKKLICTIKPDDTIIQSLMTDNSSVIYDTSSTVEVKVINPGSSGGESGAVDFTIHSNFSFDSPRTMDTGSGDVPPSILIDYSSRLNMFKGEMQHSRSSDGGNTWSDFVQVTSYQWTYGNHDYSVCADAYNNLYVAYVGEGWCGCESKFTDIWLASLVGPDSEWKSENLTAKWPFEPGGEMPVITYINSSLLIMFGVCDWGSYSNMLLTQPWTEWTQAPNIRGSAQEADHTFMIDPSGNLHFAIISSIRGTGFTPNVVHFSSNNDLSSWSPTHLISASDGYADSICITSDYKGTLYAFWLDAAAYDQPQKLYFSRSIDGGNKWSKRKIISPAGGHHFISAQTDSAGNLIIVFSKEDYGAEKIYFLRTIDGGTNWTASKKVTDQDGRSSWQALAIDSSGRLHVVWHGTGVYYARSVTY